MIKFCVEGEPTAKGRARFTGNRCYTPKKTADYEELVKVCYRLGNTVKYETEPLKCEIKAYYKIPSSDSKKKRVEKIKGLIRPTKKPDCDNVAKAILDALNGLAYKDDSQVVELHIIKYYAEQPKVEVIITEVLK